MSTPDPFSDLPEASAGAQGPLPEQVASGGFGLSPPAPSPQPSPAPSSAPNAFTDLPNNDFGPRVQNAKDPFGDLPAAKSDTSSSTKAATPTADDLVAQNIVVPGSPLATALVNRYGAALKRGTMRMMTDVDKPVALAMGGLGVIADKIYGTLTGKPTTAASDVVFKYLANPVSQTAAANAPDQNAGIDQRVVGDLPGVLSVIGQAAATGGEAPAEQAAVKLPSYTAKTADIIRDAFQTGLKGMSAPAIESAINTTNENVKNGVDLNTAVQQGLSSFVQNEMMGTIPLTAGGNIAKRMATGALTLPVFTELGRRLTNAIYGGQYASMQGKYDPKDTVVSAIEGAGFGTMPHPAEQPMDLRSPEEQQQAAAAPKEEPTAAEPPAPQPKPTLQASLNDVENKLKTATGPEADQLQQRRLALREALGLPEELPADQQPQEAAAPEFQNPHQLRVQTHLQKAESQGLSPEQSAAFMPEDTRDPVTGFFEAKDRIPTIQRAQALQTGHTPIYIEADIGNLGGLNAAVGHSTANGVYRDVASIFKEELDKTGTVVPFRHGGDEISAVVVGAKPEAIQAAVDAAKQRIQAYTHEAGYGDLVHPKHPDDETKRGVNLNVGVAPIAKDQSIPEILRAADLDVERSKLGETDVNRNEAQPAGAVAPEGQTSGAQGGAGQTPEPAAAEPATEVEQPKAPSKVTAATTAIPTRDAAGVPVNINTDHRVPYLGGTSSDGKTIYIDHRLPSTINIGGRLVDPRPFIALHERIEKPLMDRGMSYQAAHKEATAAERTAVQKAGIDWDAYQNALKPYVKTAREPSGAPIPPDIETRPYVDSAEPGLVGAKTKPARKRPSVQVKPERDDLLAAIAKLGGLKRDEAQSVYGVDPADMRMAFGHGIMRVFTKKGMPADSMAEALAQYGYPVLDEHGNYDPHILMDHVDDALRGKKVWSTHAADNVFDRMRQQHEEAGQQRDQGPALNRDEYGLGTGFDFNEPLYEDTWTPAERTAHDLARQAAKVDPDQTEAVLERWGKDAMTDNEAAQEFERIIGGEAQTDEENSAEKAQVRAAAGEAADHRPSARADSERPAATGAGSLELKPTEAPVERPRAPQPHQQDLLGNVSETRQALHREQMKRDEKRNSGQTSAETGNPNDLFSRARQQTDITDQQEKLYVRADGKQYEVKSLADAAKKHSELTQRLMEQGLGPDDVPDMHVVDGNGKQVGRISWNGRIWKPGPYKAGDKPIYDPGSASTEAKAAETKLTGKQIEDFGEKLGGARKDQVRSLAKDLTDDDIASQPLSKLWPASEIDDIEDPFARTVAFAARAEIPPKPRKGYKLKRWVEAVKLVRELGRHAIDGTLTAERLNSDPKLKDFAAKVRLLQKIDREDWSRIGDVHEYPDAYRYGADGQKEPAPHVSVSIDGRWHNYYDKKTIDDAADDVKATLGKDAGEKRMQFEVRHDRSKGIYFINKKGDSEYRRLKTFDSLDDARAFQRDNYDDLVKAWDDVKDRDNVTKADMRRKENRERTGPDYRNGEDVTPERFSSTFGFRGVEFGNWVKQGANSKERQGMLNQAYDSLMDLADILGIPPKAISLGGKLGLGLGSRGHGWASAHFEPDRVVINLTKTRGAGSLAHEWFHALDNYFARFRGEPKFGGDQGAYRRQAYVTYRPENYYVNKDVPNYTLPESVFDRMIAGEHVPGFGSLNKHYRDPAQWEKVDGVRPEVGKAFADLVHALDASPMREWAARIDKGQSDGYWSRIIERAARSFENYVIAKMADNGIENDYLANVQSPEDFQRAADRYPYLKPDEIAPVAKAFDNLFSTVKTREENGHTVLYSLKKREDEIAPTFYSKAERVLAEKLPESGPPKQLALQIQNIANGGGFKKEELDWSGLVPWLHEQTGKVTKQQILDYLRDNNIRITETTHEDIATTANRLRALFKRHDYEVEDDPYDGIIEFRDPAGNIVNPEDLPPELKAAVGNSSQSEPRYKNYSLPGGGDYQELLLTLPKRVDNAVETSAKEADAKVTEMRRKTMGLVARQPQILHELQRLAIDAAGAPENGATGFEAIRRLRQVTESPEELENVVEYGRAILNRTLADADASKSRIKNYHGPHWDEANVLAHVRFTTRHGYAGEKVLHLEEVQSDWHQKGRRQGYRHEVEEGKLPPNTRLKEIDNPALGRQYQVVAEGGTGMQGAISGSYADPQDAINEAVRHVRNEGVPDAPFKTTWPMLIMKRMLRYAAENGYDKLTWTTGEQQAERYDLSKRVSSVRLEDNSSGGAGRPKMDGPFERGVFYAYDHRGEKLIDRYITKPETIEELVGKETATKLLNQEPFEGHSAGLGVRIRELKNTDLKLGGEGMKAFYDKMLPSEMNKYIKRFGTKVGETYLGKDDNNRTLANDSIQHAAAIGAAPVHSIDITPAMKESVLHEGQPLFSRKGRTGSDRTSWEGTPKVEIATPLGTMKADPEYDAAKNGDTAAAYRLVKRVVPPEYIEHLKETLGDRKPTVVAVHAEEEPGRNQIPQAFAQYVADKLGLPYDRDIVQSNAVFHTAARAFHRIAHQATFDGPVEPGGHYLLADDTVAMGGTIANLKGHIEAHGGNVDGILALNGHQESANLAPSAETLQKIQAKHGQALDNYWRSEFGHGIDRVTAAEAGHVLKAPDLNAIRDRIAQARQASGEQRPGQADRGRQGVIRAGVRRALSTDNVHEAIDPLLNKWGDNAPRIDVVQSEDDLPSDYRDDINSVGAHGQVEGFYDPASRRVFLVADNLHKPEDAVRVLLHEVRGHFRLREFFGKDIEPVLNHVLMAYGEKGLADIMDRNGLDWNNREDRMVAAEEKLAHIAETGEKPTILQKLIATVRRWLRQFAPGLKYSDSEIRDLVANMNRPLDDGEPPAPAQPLPAGLRFSRKAAPDEKTFSDRVREAGDNAKAFLIDKTPDPVKDFLSRVANSETAGKVKAIKRGAVELAAPLGNATPEAAALAKRYANLKAESLARLNDQVEWLRKEFTPEERERMWQATSAENVARVTGQPAQGGFDTLSPKEREAAQYLQAENAKIVPDLLDDRILKHAYEIYDPRFLAGVAKEMKGNSVLNKMGHDLRMGTKHALEREHITAEETERAAKELYGDEAHLIKDILILPFAMHQLRNIQADKGLIESVRQYGLENDTELVVANDKMTEPMYKGYKTIDAPAFREYVPRYIEQDGKLVPMRDQNGRIIMQAQQLYFHPDMESPFKAVLHTNGPNELTKAFVALKSKSMGVIVGLFPPVHRSVIFFKTVFTYPSAMLTGRLQALGEELRTTDTNLNPVKRALVRMGKTGKIRQGMDDNEALRQEKYQAVRDGLRDVSFRQWVGSLEDIEQVPTIDEKVGKSWTAQMLGLGAKLAGKAVGHGDEWSHAVRKAVDDLGHLWHSRWMWEKVANTQYGLYRMVKNDLVGRGMTPDGAGKVAAQVANRFAGAIPREDMGQGVRTFLNLTFFSRSFTFSNMGIYKDAMVSLPNAIRGQLNQADMKIGKSAYRRVAATVLVKDITAFLAINSALQSAVAYFTHRKSGDQILDGYKERLARWWDAGHYNPFVLATSINDLTANSENEPGKTEYIYLGRQPNGTAIYLKNPFGKIGMDLLDTARSPLQLLHRKESTLIKPALDIYNNDAGYGRQVYDPNADGIGGAASNILRVADHFVQAQGPTDLLGGTTDLATGKDRSAVNWAKTLGAPAGLFFSKGAPGGPAVGMMYAAEKEHDFQKQQIMPDARKAILAGDNAKAIELMRSAHMTPPEMMYTFKSTLAPESALTKQRILKFMMVATPDERRAFQEELKNQ